MENRPFNIDWKAILAVREKAPELEVVTGECESPKETFDDISDQQLEEKIQRIRSNLSVLILKDGGAKLRASLKKLEAEREQRKLLRVPKVADDRETPMRSQNSTFFDPSDGVSTKRSTAQTHPLKTFDILFSERLEDKPGSSIDVAAGAFTDELTCMHSGNHMSPSRNGSSTTKETKRTKISSRQSPFQCPTTLSTNKDSNKHLDRDDKGVSPSSYSCFHQQDKLASYLPDKLQCFGRRDSPARTSLDLKRKKVQTVVLLDEEDAQPMHKPQQGNEPIGKTKETQIYYPSRNHPESVEICYSDMECLAPQSFLSSPIMNFYIQYLQRPEYLSGRPRGDYHFFNTYFYKKLEEAVSYKRNNKKDSFVKFRRWWRGANIFQKAYIFLPIHADQHWSLVIICIPAIEDETGPNILHLDSLGLHPSSQIFENVERFLREEWRFLRHDVTPPDLPISKKIWKNLPSKIQRKIIKVPQQENEYDCGLFVLFFMKRFIEDAPDRVRKGDLSMFGRKWFDPEEASGLRQKIRRLLNKEFENAEPEKINKSPSPCSPTGSSSDCE